MRGTRTHGRAPAHTGTHARTPRTNACTQRDKNVHRPSKDPRAYGITIVHTHKYTNINVQFAPRAQHRPQDPGRDTKVHPIPMTSIQTTNRAEFWLKCKPCKSPSKQRERINHVVLCDLIKFGPLKPRTTFTLQRRPTSREHKEVYVFLWAIRNGAGKEV